MSTLNELHGRIAPYLDDFVHVYLRCSATYCILRYIRGVSGKVKCCIVIVKADMGFMIVMPSEPSLCTNKSPCLR